MDEETEIFERTLLFLLSKLQERKDEKDVFSEKGIESFAEFAWEMGKALTRMRRFIGWEPSLIKDMAEVLKEVLDGKVIISSADLFHFCEYYAGCEKLSMLLLRPSLTSPLQEGVSCYKH